MRPNPEKAMQTTVLGLLGNMSPFAQDTSTEITAESLASLMFQLQVGSPTLAL